MAPRHERQARDARCQGPHARRKQTVDPVVGIIKSALDVTRFHLRGLGNVANEWTLVALAWNGRRLRRLRQARTRLPAHMHPNAYANPAGS
jgi:hypothetical protein